MSEALPIVGPALRRYPTKKRLFRFALLACVPLAMGGCAGVLDPRGPVGASERLILIDSLAIMLAIVIPVIVATVGFAWWFRAGNTKAIYLPEWEFNGTLELIVWSIPMLVIVVLGGVAWYGSHEMDPWKPLPTSQKPLEIEVVSLDWKWLFLYPEQKIASVNELVLPTGRSVHFRLTSATVMNSFFVPQLGTQIYTMAGMTSQLYLQADQPGIYRGLSAQFSGDLFSDMHFDVRAASAEDFTKWAADAKGSKPLDAAAYSDLVKTQSIEAPATFGSVQDGLFDSIVDQTAPQTMGPEGSLIESSPRKGT